MPAAYLHESITKNVLKKIKVVPDYVKSNIFAYELGAQGPDYLFYYNLLRFWDKNFEPNELGEDMHKKKIGAFFSAVLQSAKNHGDAAKAWLCGFVTHYAADTTIHPFVYAWTDNPDGSRNLLEHLSIEAQFDTWYYRKVLGKKGIPRQASCAKKMTGAQKDAVASAVYEACHEIYPERELTKAQAQKSIGDMNALVALLYSPYKIKHAIYVLIEKLIGKPRIITCHEPAHKLPEYDFLNLEKKTWENPWDRNIKSDKSLPELFDIAVEKGAVYSKTVIDYFDETISLEDACKVLGSNSYSSGLNVPG